MRVIMQTYEFLLVIVSELFSNFDSNINPNLYPMKNTSSYKFLFLSIIYLSCSSLIGQKNDASNFSSSIKEAQDVSNYQKLKSLGYSEQEIFEDLGNANFLLEKYENAAFWYKKLMDRQKGKSVSNNYKKRYQFALEQSRGANTIVAGNKDWLDQIKTDYKLKREFEDKKSSLSEAETFREFYYRPNLRSQSLDYLVEFERNKAFVSASKTSIHKNTQNPFKEPIAIAANGRTAYFSKAIYIKPAKGIFSKKELVHKIYKTDKINGQWKNVQEVVLCPKNYSTMQPAISDDGKRLFFASNMPGTFGKFDIYTADISNDGAIGQAMNLGAKVNTKKNELYPSLTDRNTLVFASEGREGYGGLDLYMTQVDRKKVGWATNLGSPINSPKDDFSMYLMAEKGIGYVLSNRGSDKNEIQQVAFSYSNKDSYEKPVDSNLATVLNNKLTIDYTTTMFEDQ